MKLVKPSYEIFTPINREDILKQIEFVARTCKKSEDKIEYSNNSADSTSNKMQDYYATSARVLASKLMNKGHEAMFEFGGSIAVKFICDRGISHELVRHRLASFAQESTRYCNYSKAQHITFIIPSWLDIEDGIYTHRDPIFKDRASAIWVTSMLNSEEYYNTLIGSGWSAQQARTILPHSLKTEINISANIREWRHILKLRTAKSSHPQMRELMCPLLDELKSKIPILFDDITY